MIVKKIMFSLSIVFFSIVQLAAMEKTYDPNNSHCTATNAYEFLVQRKQWTLIISKRLDEIPIQLPLFTSGFLTTCFNLINEMYDNFSKSSEARPFPLAQNDVDELVKNIQGSAISKGFEYCKLFPLLAGLTQQEINILREKIKSEIVLDGLEKTFNYLLVRYPGLKDIFSSFDHFWMADWS